MLPPVVAAQGPERLAKPPRVELSAPKASSRARWRPRRGGRPRARARARPSASITFTRRRSLKHEFKPRRPPRPAQSRGRGDPPKRPRDAAEAGQPEPTPGQRSDRRFPGRASADLAQSSDRRCGRTPRRFFSALDGAPGGLGRARLRLGWRMPLTTPGSELSNPRSQPIHRVVHDLIYVDKSVAFDRDRSWSVSITGYAGVTPISKLPGSALISVRYRDRSPIHSLYDYE